MDYQFNKFYYKPLPEALEVRESDIEGSGVFAKEKIDGHTDLGMTHIKVPIIQGYIRTPLGGFVNHSSSPNCCLVQEMDWDDDRIVNFYPIRTKQPGEELSLIYHADEDS